MFIVSKIHGAENVLCQNGTLSLHYGCISLKSKQKSFDNYLRVKEIAIARKIYNDFGCYYWGSSSSTRGEKLIDYQLMAILS